MPASRAARTFAAMAGLLRGPCSPLTIMRGVGRVGLAVAPGAEQVEAGAPAAPAAVNGFDVRCIERENALDRGAQGIVISTALARQLLHEPCGLEDPCERQDRIAQRTGHAISSRGEECMWAVG